MIRPACTGCSLGMLHRLPILLACPLFLAFATEVQADFTIGSNDICLPEVNPHPDWWSPGLTRQQREARWSGASVRKEIAGTRSARLRAVWSTSDTIYVEATVSGDPTLDDEDAFVFAISDEAQTLPELYVEFPPWRTARCGRTATATGSRWTPRRSGTPRRRRRRAR